MKRGLFLAGIVVLMVILPALVAACGGFFCTTTPIDQNAERIIFAVNKDAGTITAVVGINYTGEAKDFSWVVPVPSPPTLDVAETASLDLLQAGTDKQFIEPPNYCAGLSYATGDIGKRDSDSRVGHIGPYDYTIIRNENPDELVGWLRDNGYQVTDEMFPIIADYVEDGMYFLAMKLSQDAQVGDIQPIVMTYESEKPMIPIRLTAVAAVPDMPIITWIFGDSQYIPENYVSATPDYRRFRSASQIISFGANVLPPSRQYRDELYRLQDEYNGLAFITEYAQPAENLPPAVQDDLLMKKFIAEHPYVTRLRAQMSPWQMTRDPIFRPQPEYLDVAETVDLNAYVDPLQYWGCSTISVANLADEGTLFAHMRIDEFHFQIGHPSDWIVSQGIINNNSVWVFSPQPSDLSNIMAFFEGKPTAPMLVVIRDECSEYVDFCINPGRSFIRSLGMPENTVIPEGSKGQMILWNDLYEVFGDNGMLYAVLASEKQWEENDHLFTAMMAYPYAYAYYAHPALRHTLFLGEDYANEQPPVMAGFPEGWIARWDNEEDIAVFVPEFADTNSPIARLLPVSRFVTDQPLNLYPSLVTLEAVATYYELGDSAWKSIQETYRRGCAFQISDLPFAKDGRQGYIGITPAYVLEASALEADFATYDETLKLMSEGVDTPPHFKNCG